MVATVIRAGARHRAGAPASCGDMCVLPCGASSTPRSRHQPAIVAEVVSQRLGVAAHTSDRSRPRRTVRGPARTICADVRPHHEAGRPLKRQSSGSSARALIAALLIGALRGTAICSFKLARRDTPRFPTPMLHEARDDVPEQFRIRQAKRERLLAEGREPYPVEVARTHTPGRDPCGLPGPARRTRRPASMVGVAGRVMFARNSGKLCFATLQEGDGTQLQVDDQPRPVSGRSRSTRGRPTSTSATSCSCTVR